MLNRIGTSAAIQGERVTVYVPGLCIGMHRIGLGGGIENSRNRITKIPYPLGKRAAAVEAGHIGKLCALSLAGVL